MGKFQNILNSIFNTISSLKGQLREMFGLNFFMDLLCTYSMYNMGLRF
jgi:hypothetical protein